MPLMPCAASLQERLEPLPGDELVADPVVTATHAICIDAPPAQVWPWLAQMGGGRAGWYSHDWLDNGGVPSEERLVPALQRLCVGDVLPTLPGSREGFVVASVEPPSRLVLVWSGAGDGCTASWAFVLRPAPRGDRTRLVVRARLSHAALRAAPGSADPVQARAFVERIYRAAPHVPVPVLRAMASLGHGLMQSKQLRGIKQRAEGHAAH